MKYTMTGVCLAAAIGFAATLGAQAPSTTTTATPDKGDREITITGCLTKTGGDFMLMNARVDDPKSSTTTAGTTTAGTTTTAGATTTAGTTATSGTVTPATPMMWKLSGGSDLDRHVGHRIAVTGKAEQSHASTTTSATTSTSTTAATTTTAPSAPKLDVKSIKMISTSCS